MALVTNIAGKQQSPATCLFDPTKSITCVLLLLRQERDGYAGPLACTGDRYGLADAAAPSRDQGALAFHTPETLVRLLAVIRPVAHLAFHAGRRLAR